jgi:uncharacterized RmlC-like cupin family protein
MTHDHSAERWSVRVIPGNQLDPNVPSTPGMDRKAAINFARAGAKKLWAGTVTIKPDAKTGAHHHGHLESIIYVVRGKARMRWGDRLQFTAEANPGDFIFIPPYVPHQKSMPVPNRFWIGAQRRRGYRHQLAHRAGGEARDRVVGGPNPPRSSRK